MSKPDFKEKIDRLIINSPFEEPKQHWEFERTKGKHFIKAVSPSPDAS